MYWPTGTDEVHSEETWRFFSLLNARQNEMSLLHDAMMEILRLLPGDRSAIVEADGVGKDIWNFFPILVSYCCDISERKKVS